MGSPGFGPYADDAEEFADEHQERGAGDYATQLGNWCRRVLVEHGHDRCQWIPRAKYLPDSAAVVCGCGEFAPAPVVQPADGSDQPARVAGTVAYEARDPIASTLALIDPSEIYTPDQVERHILDVLARLETGALFERECIVRADSAVAAWNRVYFATIHTSEQTSELKRKAEAEVECEQRGLTHERDEAKMIASAAKATMHNLRAVLSGYQSVAKSVTAAYNPGGSAGRF